MSLSLHIANQEISAVIYNDDFVILKPISQETELHLISKVIYNSKFDFIDEVIGTEVEICLKLNERFEHSHLKQLEGLDLGKAIQQKTFKLPVYMDEKAEDWKLIEAYSGIKREDYLTRLAKCDFTLSMFGFLPGFLYMKGIAPELAIPRKSTPAKRVPAGSLAIGGDYLGLYSLASPGGWNVIGQSPIMTFDLEKLPPSPLQPGDKINLNLISEKTHSALTNNPLTLTEYNELL